MLYEQATMQQPVWLVQQTRKNIFRGNKKRLPEIILTKVTFYYNFVQYVFVLNGS